MKNKSMEALARNSILILWAIFALFPLVWMVIISFKSDAQMFNTT
ncbi:MAG: carbohydrate ABC transporter permease, partial [Fretibacterium sp.]|nr:carbohydrate ABC transporter permease [Fretibacterium sp.]